MTRSNIDCDGQLHCLSGSFKIVGQYLKHLSFENANYLRSLTLPESNELSLDWNISGKQLEDNLFESLLSLECYTLVHNPINKLEDKLFSISISYAATVSIIHQDIKEKMLEHIIYVDAPQLIFPFVRKIVSDTTSSGGYKPIYLDCVDFASIYRCNM